MIAGKEFASLSLRYERNILTVTLPRIINRRGGNRTLMHPDYSFNCLEDKGDTRL